MTSPESVARFNREMKAVGKLDHPHIVRATDAGEADGTHYLVMEFVEGIDLAELLKRNGPLPIAAACELVRQAALGLQAAHARGMVHRDVKPANLMLARQEFGPPLVKVLDLGLALLAETHAADATGLTSEGHIMGTIDFMAPEQAGDSHAVDARADVYSLGATLYALLSGGSIFAGREFKTAMQKLSALATQSAPPLRDRRPEIPAALAEVIHRMLARNPGERYATTADVAAVLGTFAAGAELSSLLDEPHAERSGNTDTVAWETQRIGPKIKPAFCRVAAGRGSSISAGCRRIGSACCF
jgi:serine/threonine protein kinase